MTMHPLLLALSLTVLPFLSQCSSTSPGEAAPLPVLSSPARAAAWGAGQTVKTPEGYQTTYINPANRKERVRIIASRKLMFHILYPPTVKGTQTVNGVTTQVSEPQLWQSSYLNGEPVRWYQESFPTPERAAVFKTLGAEFKNGSGQGGQYRIEAEGTKNQMQTWLSELRFAQE